LRPESETKPVVPSFIVAVDEGIQKPKHEEHYDLMMGYYIIMGGFIIETSVGRYGALTADDIKCRAQRGIFDRIGGNTIKDEFLAKFLVCSQVIWMGIEVSCEIFYFVTARGPTELYLTNPNIPRKIDSCPQAFRLSTHVAGSPRFFACSVWGFNVCAVV
jgi:hypothetical protein